MAKYDSMRKLERNRLLLQYREEHPELSWQEIGDAWNISAQRAWEIVKIEQKKRVTVSQSQGLSKQEGRP